MVTINGAPHRQKACIEWGAAWFPKGRSFLTLLLLPQCHAAISMIPSTLIFGRPEPHQRACVVVTLYRVTPPHLLLPPT